VPTKLEVVKSLIATRLIEFPLLSARRLLAECRAAGYTGGYTRLCDYVRSLRPPPVVAPVVRFETAPGIQAQVDFAYCRLPWGMRYALIVVLGYSRLLWVRFYPRQDLRTLIHGLEACFAWWGGVPQELLLDQMKSVLTRDDRLPGGGLTHSLEFLRFMRHYGITPRVCRRIGPKRRARSSGPSATCATTPLRTHLPERRRPQRAGRTLAGDHREPPRAWDHPGGPAPAL